MTCLRSLTLQNFRSYGILQLDDIPAKNIILCGVNGAGKTNILEALSLFAPGRGLRSAKVPDMQKQDSDAKIPWVVTANMQTKYGDVQIGTARNPQKDNRLIKVNGTPAKAQSELGDWLSCLWLTPQMDRLFLDDKSARRRFFDRLVFTFDPGHMGRLTRYENAMRQRLRLLKDGQNDDMWLGGLEIQMAEAAIAICAGRHHFCEKLQNAYISATEDERNSFPSALLNIIGDIENILSNNSALEAEDTFKNQLKKNRISDAESGVTRVGPHRSDFDVIYQQKNMPAAQSSTGEQKALLIGIILAHARLLQEEHGHAPLLLLDEIVAHLDPNRRKILAGLLQSYGSQVWMTGTDQTLFQDFINQSCLYQVADSSVSKYEGYAPVDPAA